MWKVLCDLIFVPHCVACDARVASGPLCPPCAESLYEPGPACPRCAEPLAGPIAVVCARCRRRPPPFAAAAAAYRYGGELSVALCRLKYGRRPDIARSLGPLIAPALAQAAASFGADVAVPVPLHWRRHADRGFNQAARLLAHASRYTPGMPIDRLSLRRCRHTAPQSGLDRARRAANLRAAFAVVPRRRERVAGRRVLLFDDVMTTGATASECARALLAAGASAVLAFAAARAEL